MSFPYSDVREVTLTPCNMFDVSVPHFWREQRPREGAVGSDFKIDASYISPNVGIPIWDTTMGFPMGFSAHGEASFQSVPGKNFAGDETDFG